MKDNIFIIHPKFNFFVLSIGVGLGILITILTILGYVGLLNSTIIKIILYTLSIFFLYDLYILKNINLKISNFFFDVYTIPVLACLVIISFLYLITSLTPTLDGDSLNGYLSLAREYSENNKMVPNDFYFGATFPQNGQLLSTIGYLLQGQITAQLIVSWLMGVLCCFTIIIIGRQFFDLKSGLIASLIWYGTYAVAFINQSAKVDLAWTHNNK